MKFSQLYVEIKKAELEDFDSIYHFVNGLKKTVFAYEKQKEIFKENISNLNNIYLVASYQGTPIGFVSCHIQLLLHHNGKVGEIQEAYVTKAFRSHGIGRMLLKRLKELGEAHQVLQLEVTSGLNRIEAHRFYEREGFQHTHKKFVYVYKED